MTQGASSAVVLLACLTLASCSRDVPSGGDTDAGSPSPSPTSPTSGELPSETVTSFAVIDWCRELDPAQLGPVARGLGPADAEPGPSCSWEGRLVAAGEDGSASYPERVDAVWHLRPTSRTAFDTRTARAVAADSRCEWTGVDSPQVTGVCPPPAPPDEPPERWRLTTWVWDEAGVLRCEVVGSAPTSKAFARQAAATCAVVATEAPWR